MERERQMKRCLAGMAALLLVLAAGCRRTPSPDGSESEGLPSASSDVTLPWEPSPDSETVPTSSPTPTTPEPTRSSPPSSAPTASSPPTTAVPTEPPRAETVRLTFKEGDSLTKIFQKLEDGGVTTVAKLMEASDTLDLSEFPLAAAMPQDSRRCFRLEGYLFPDTYEFYIGERPDRVLRRMLQNTEKRITSAIRQEAASAGRSVDEILIIASVIQREGSKTSEMPKIAGILYNRLRDGMRLQMDSTTDFLQKQIEPYLPGGAARFAPSYDTYRIDGLPAGPICSPGLAAIRAALAPADVDYLYFCNDAEANYYYAVTYEEHLANIEKAGLRSPDGTGVS